MRSFCTLSSSTALTLSLALLLTLGGCASDEPGAGGPGGGVVLADSTDGSGKADAIGGRVVHPMITETVYVDGSEYAGTFTVSDVTETSLVVSGPAIAVGAQADGLQLTVLSDDSQINRFVLMHRASSVDEWTPLVIESSAIYEAMPNEEMEGAEVSLQISYFQTVSIRTFGGEITFSSDDVVGQVTVPLGVEAPTEREWAAFVIAVETDWDGLAGDYAFTIEASCGGDVCTPPGETPTEPPIPADIYADARNPDLAVINVMGAAPESYDRPERSAGMGLGGTEFWQQWPGGHSPTFSFSAGTDQGRTCMQASAIRWETIMADPPARLTAVLDTTNWTGSWFNWNDDYTESDFSDARGARLWAWRTGLIKWISQTGRDGSCHLPTREMVERLAESCLNTGEGDGEIQGCSAR